MSGLDGQHQDTLIEWLSSHTPTLQRGADAYYQAMCDLSLPHVVMRPRVYKAGGKWRSHYGERGQDGVTGIGDSPAKACADFDNRWLGRL